jgi:dinuclear metal center YbgI/SA1388 family protein
MKTEPHTVSRSALLAAADGILQPERFKDYGPNGLQVEGRERVGKLVTGVTASLALIEAAIEAKADAILVHHGLFWRGQDGRVTGWMKQRLQRLLTHDVSLLAYHLPLDAQPVWGNNARIGQLMGWNCDAHFGDQQLGCMADAPFSDLAELVDQVSKTFGRAPVVVGHHQRPIRRVAWCSGGAQSYFEDAIAAGADVFLTGELSEPQTHYARECGVVYVAAGHHATERYGVQAVGEALALQLGIEHQFIDIDNPA